MQVEDFFPSYITVPNDEVISDIAHRREFRQLKLKATEEVPKIGRGQLLNHQKIMQRIMAPYTGHNSILIDHGMGTGKTCNIFGIAEAYLAFQDRMIKLTARSSLANADLRIEKKKVFILVKSDNARRNMVDELSMVCTDGKYQPEQTKDMTTRKMNTRIKKLYSENYEIATFETFSRKIQHNLKRPDFIDMYSNRLIIIDEVHNLRPTVSNMEIYAKFDDIVRDGNIDVEQFAAVPGASNKRIENYLKGGVLDVLYNSILENKVRSKSGVSNKALVEAHIDQLIQDGNLVLGEYRDLVVNTLTEAVTSESSPSDTLNEYGRIHAFLHTIRQPRVILLSGTPMVDRASEIIDIFNLILPSDQQMKRYKSKSDNVDKIIKQLTKNDRIRGLVSYLDQMVTNVPRVDVGISKVDTPSAYTEHLKLKLLRMSKYQSDVYEMATKKDHKKNDDEIQKEIDGKKGQVAWQSSRQAANFAFPNDKWGVAGAKGIDYKVVARDIDKYSVKLNFILETLKKHNDECSFIYSHDVSGGGINAIVKVFETLGWTQAKGGERKPSNEKKRFAVITGQTSASQAEAIRRTFNNPENWDGSYIRVIIGSESAAEALSFHHITRIFMFTPEWNNSKAEQSIYRGIRVGSHNVVWEKRNRKNVNVKVYRLATTTYKGDPTVDVYMYQVAEKKDVDIMKIQRILKTNSIDCELTRDRNRLETDVDGSRKCNYEKCDYECNTQSVSYKGVNNTTFNIYYSTDLQREIRDYILEQLKHNYYLPLQSLYNKYSKHVRLVDLTLAQIYNQYTTISVGNFEYQLTVSSSMIMLAPMSGQVQPGYLGVYYSRNPMLQLSYKMSDLIDYQRQSYDLQLLELYMKGQEIKNVADLSDETLAQIFTIILSKDVKSKCSAKLIDYYQHRGDLDLTNKTYRINGVTYKVKDGKSIIVQQQQRLARVKVDVTDEQISNKGKLWGYLDDKGNLKIMDFTTNRKPTGRNCSYLTAVELIMYLKKLGVPALTKVNLSKNEIIEELRKVKGFKEQLTNYSEKELKYILPYSTYKKTSTRDDGDTLCSILKDALKERDLLLDV